MKRYDCTLSDKRGAFGDCMEAHSTGRYVLFSDVEKLQRRMQDLLDKSNRTGVAIERAISTGSVLASLHQGRPDTEWTDAATSPVAADYRELQVQHDQVQSRLKGALDLLQEAHEVMRRNVPNSPQGFANRADILDRIEAELAGRVKGRTLTEGQEFELTTVLQSIANGFSDDPAHDAAALLKRIAGEVPWTGDSFQLPPRQAGLLCNQQHSLAGQVFAGLSAATALSVLDANSAADVVQLMLEEAEAKGGESCDSASQSSSPD